MDEAEGAYWRRLRQEEEAERWDSALQASLAHCSDPAARASLIRRFSDAKAEGPRRERLAAEVYARRGVAHAWILGQIVGEPGGTAAGTWQTTGTEFETRTADILSLGKNARAVLLSISSPGGSARAAAAMIRGIRDLQKAGIPVVASVERRALSGAAIAALEADYLVIGEGATMMLHAVSGGLEAHREHFAQSFREIVTRRTPLTPAQAEGMLSASAGCDFDFTVRDAVRHGLADEVGPESRAEDIARDLAARKPLPSSPRQVALAIRRQRAADEI